MADSFLDGTIEYTDEVGDSLDIIMGNFNGLDAQLGVVSDYIDTISPIATWDVDTLSLTIANNIYASRVYTEYNDLADFQRLADKLVYGKCYVDTKAGAKIATERCQLGVAGIASDTFGLCLGGAKDGLVPLGVAGYVLAYVDKEYPTGTPLTNDARGNLTEMTLQEKRDYPERLVATYKKIEEALEWGPENSKIKVSGRHWVKIK